MKYSLSLSPCRVFGNRFSTANFSVLRNEFRISAISFNRISICLTTWAVTRMFVLSSEPLEFNSLTPSSIWDNKWVRELTSCSAAWSCPKWNVSSTFDWSFSNFFCRSMRRFSRRFSNLSAASAPKPWTSIKRPARRNSSLLKHSWNTVLESYSSSMVCCTASIKISKSFATGLMSSWRHVLGRLIHASSIISISFVPYCPSSSTDWRFLNLWRAAMIAGDLLCISSNEPRTFSISSVILCLSWSTKRSFPFGLSWCIDSTRSTQFDARSILLFKYLVSCSFAYPSSLCLILSTEEGIELTSDWQSYSLTKFLTSLTRLNSLRSIDLCNLCNLVPFL